MVREQTPANSETQYQASDLGSPPSEAFTEIKNIFKCRHGQRTTLDAILNHGLASRPSNGLYVPMSFRTPPTLTSWPIHRQVTHLAWRAVLEPCCHLATDAASHGRKSRWDNLFEASLNCEEAEEHPNTTEGGESTGKAVILNTISFDFEDGLSANLPFEKFKGTSLISHPEFMRD